MHLFITECGGNFTVLHYIYEVTFNLFIAVTVITLFFALCKTLFGKTGFRIQLGGTILGLLAAGYRAVRHAFMSTFDVEINLYTFYVGFVAMALLLILLTLFGRKRAPAWGKATAAFCTAV